MSAIAALFNVPTTPEEFSTWSFAHAAHHVDINRAIYQLSNIQVSSFVIDPLDISSESARNVWEYLHQQMHDEMDRLLLIKGFDLTEVPWQDPGGFSQWVYMNANEHYQAANTLGIG